MHCPSLSQGCCLFKRCTAPAEPSVTEAPDSTKDSPAVDSRGVWHVHVQASATGSQAATAPKPRESTQAAQRPHAAPTPSAPRSDSSCTAAPTMRRNSFQSSRDALSPRQNGSLAAATVATGGTGSASAAPSSAQGSSMPLPQLRIRVPKSNVRHLDSLSETRDSACMPCSRSAQSGAQDTCNTDSALAGRSTGGRIVSKHSTASASSAVSADSDVHNIPLVSLTCMCRLEPALALNVLLLQCDTTADIACP